MELYKYTKERNFMSVIAANSSNQIAALKELYTDDKEYMKDLVYKANPFLALVPKDESPDGFAGEIFARVLGN